MYPEPSSYNPDRFLKDGQLDKTVRDPNVAFFGFGRRICPGRFLSEDSMFIIISHILTVFDVRPALDEEGNEIKIEPRMTGSVLS
jgi:cytochrome P450